MKCIAFISKSKNIKQQKKRREKCLNKMSESETNNKKNSFSVKEKGKKKWNNLCKKKEEIKGWKEKKRNLFP